VAAVTGLSCGYGSANCSASPIRPGLKVTVTHLPPGTSKWNRIEHRLFAFITQNWRGKPQVSHQVIVQLIGATTTETGLKVGGELDGNLYPNGIKVTDRERQTINIARAEFHGE
jgi:hypothetical protein